MARDSVRRGIASRAAMLAAIALLALLVPARAQDTAPEAPPEPAPDTAPAPGAPPAPPPEWLPRQAADLVALDKIGARTEKLSVAVGQAVQFGSLTIAVRSCEVRPPDRPADATAWLDIADSKPGTPQFHAWILMSAPSVSGLEHPAYDVQLAGCH